MNNTPKRKKKEILKAVKDSGGVLTVIAKRLGISRQTVAKYRDNIEAVEEAILEAQEAVTDKAEENIIKRISKEDIEISKWWLRTIGSKRGFVETQKHDVDVEGNVTLNFIPADDKS